MADAALPFAEIAVRVCDPTGLHARPAVRFTRAAKRFSAKVEVARGGDGPWFDAKSPTAVMKLRVGFGEPIVIRASGIDAQAAVSALAALVGDAAEDAR